jgi:hypothetical protein
MGRASLSNSRLRGTFVLRESKAQTLGAQDGSEFAGAGKIAWLERNSSDPRVAAAAKLLR